MAKSLLEKLGQIVGMVEKASPEDYAPEIIDAMAEEMPPREGVWWAVLSGKEVDPDILTPEDLAALEAAEAWVLDPSEATAATAEQAIEKVDFQGPGAWAAVAAVSVPLAAVLGGAGGAGAALAVAPAAATAAGIAPKAVAGAVKLAAALANGQKPEKPAATDAATAASEAAAPVEPAAAAAAGDAAKTAEALKPFIDTGKDIMQGNNTWG